MDRWQAMRVFVKVAETGSFAEAARALYMSPPAVTRAIAALEDLIGTRLLVRTTRSVKLTEAGARYRDDCRRILAETAEAEAAAAGSYATPTGLLTVGAPVLFGQIHVLPIVTEFLARHPAVTGRTLFVDRIVNIVEEGVDVAIRIAHLPDSGYSAIRVGSVRRVICASPAYLDQHGMPRHPDDLADHVVIASTSVWGSPEWHFGPDGATRVTVHPRLFCNTNQAALSAAIGGMGLTRLISYQAGAALADGTLRAVLTDHEEAPLPVHIAHPDGRRASAKVRAFVDLATERLRANRMIG